MPPPTNEPEDDGDESINQETQDVDYDGDISENSGVDSAMTMLGRATPNPLARCLLMPDCWIAMQRMSSAGFPEAHHPK